MQQRIAIVTETYYPEINGVAHTLRHLTQGLLSNACEVQVVRPKQFRDDRASRKNGLEQLIVPGLPIPGYKGLMFGLPRASLLTRLWRKKRPDAIYVATEGPLGFSAIAVAQKLGIHVISGFHTNFQAYSRYYRIGWLESLILGYLRYLHNRTDATLVPTQKQANHLTSKGFKSVKVFNRGVDCELFTPKRRSWQLRTTWGLSGDEVVCLYVGRLAAEKNLALLSTAYQRLKVKYPELVFVYVGDGPLRKQLERKHPDIIFSGMQQGETLAQHYASADIFMFPSQTDTFGNVVTEAMASKLCVVSFDDAAAKEHLQHRRSALLSKSGHDEHFISNLEQAYSNQALRDLLRTKAHQLAQKISWQEVNQQFQKTLAKPQCFQLEGWTNA